MTSNKERRNHLRFLDAIFPLMKVDTKVKVIDKRFKKGFYYGFIVRVWKSNYRYGMYQVFNTENQKCYWVFRDNIEVRKDE